MDKIPRETEFIEFKESTTELEDGLVAIVAMLNKRCRGDLYFGVANNGEVIGQDVGRRTITEISQAFENHIDPTLIPTIDVMKSDEGKEYIRVHAEGIDRPYAFKGAIYMRSGDENKIVPMSELRRMFQGSTDLLRGSAAVNQDLTFGYLCAQLRSRGFHVKDDPKFHRSHYLLNASGEFNIQAELLSDQNPLPISVVIFGGADRMTISVRKQFQGSLLSMLREARDYVENLNESQVDMTGADRIERRLIDSAAFDEAWVNACVHNSWLLGIPPTIHVFNDRLEIISYGGKPYYQDDDEFFNGETMPVNETLMQIFLAAGVTEHTGHGIPVITGIYGREAFVLDNATVKVILRFPFERGGGLLTPSIPSGSSVNEARIIAIMLEDPKCTIDSISSQTGIGRSNVGKIIKSLKDRGVVSREGSKKTGSWVVRGRRRPRHGFIHHFKSTKVDIK